MSDNEALDDVRRTALDYADYIDTITKIMIGFAAAAEIGLGILLFYLTDFSDPVHRLIFVAAAAVYSPLVCCLGAFWFHLDRWSRRILKAIELTQHGETPSENSVTTSQPE